MSVGRKPPQESLVFVPHARGRTNIKSMEFRIQLACQSHACRTYPARFPAGMGQDEDTRLHLLQLRLISARLERHRAVFSPGLARLHKVVILRR